MADDSQVSQPPPPPGVPPPPPTPPEAKSEASDLDYVTRREIGREAVWSLSSAKPGNGVDQLRDDSIETYWQSDGGQPHLINIQFHKKMTVVEMAYTPKKLSIRAGSSFHDLVEVTVKELHEPVGWMRVQLSAPVAGSAGVVVAADSDGGPQGPVLRAHFVQICVVAMHQNGRDTHIRQVKVFGPRLASAQHDPSLVEFISPEFEHFQCIR
eukprot:jgi/Undpi1/2008/HiC_scaffold_12.g05395.m1